jgi:hypothetical protein
MSIDDHKTAISYLPMNVYYRRHDAISFHLIISEI